MAEKPPPDPNWSVAISPAAPVGSWSMKRVAPTAVTHGDDAGHEGYSTSPGTGGGPGGPGDGGAARPDVAFGFCTFPVTFEKPRHSCGLNGAPLTKVQYGKPLATACEQHAAAESTRKPDTRTPSPLYCVLDAGWLHATGGAGGPPPDVAADPESPDEISTEIPRAAIAARSPSTSATAASAQLSCARGPCHPYEIEKTDGAASVDRMVEANDLRSAQKSWASKPQNSVLTPGATPMMYSTSRAASTPDGPRGLLPTTLSIAASSGLVSPATYSRKNLVRSDASNVWPWNSPTACRFAAAPTVTPLIP
mmetsp:Transcript_13494/g.34636  ORF Transcript_13494/g.34636 Transcript_13494/m.34636 type:complete len:308 (+) Transcript_13494:647-1570(+)